MDSVAAPVCVLLVNGHTLVREAIAALLKPYDEVKVVATARTGQEAVARTRAVRPDVVVLDVSLPDQSGIATCREVRRLCPPPAVLMIGSPRAQDWIFASIAAGAAGCLLMDIDGCGLKDALLLVASGKSFLDPSLTPDVFRRLRNGDPSLVPADERLARLTAAERRILELVAKGHSNREIANKVGYALPTVKKYVSSILAKLEVSRRTQAVAYLNSHGGLHDLGSAPVLSRASQREP